MLALDRTQPAPSASSVVCSQPGSELLSRLSSFLYAVYAQLLVIHTLASPPSARPPSIVHACCMGLEIEEIIGNLSLYLSPSSHLSFGPGVSSSAFSSILKHELVRLLHYYSSSGCHCHSTRTSNTLASKCVCLPSAPIRASLLIFSQPAAYRDCWSAFLYALHALTPTPRHPHTGLCRLPSTHTHCPYMVPPQWMRLETNGQMR